MTGETVTIKSRFVLVLLTFALAAAGPAAADPWTVQNDNIALSFDLRIGGGMTLTGIVDLATGHSFLSYPTSFFELSADGAPIERSSDGFIVDAYSPVDFGLSVSGHTRDIPLGVNLTITAWPGDPAAVLRVEFVNNSFNPLRVRAVLPKIHGLASAAGDDTMGAVPQEMGSVSRLFQGRAGKVAALMRNSNQEELFWAGRDGTIYWTTQRDDSRWANPETIASRLAAPRGSVAAVVRNDVQQDVFWVGADGVLYTTFQNYDAPWFPIPYALTGPAFAPPGAPVAAFMQTSNTETACAVGAQGDAIWCVSETANSPFSQPYPLPLALPDHPVPGGYLVALAVPDGSVDVFWASAFGNLYATRFAFGQWAPPSAINWDIVVPAGAPLAAVWRDGVQEDVFFVGWDGALWTAYNPGGQWQRPLPITGTNMFPVAADVAATMRDGTQEDVFAVSGDGAIWTTWQNANSPWFAPLPVTDTLLVPPGGNVAAVRRTSTHEDIFFRGRDGGLWTVFEQDNGAFSPQVTLGDGVVLGMPFNVDVGLPTSMNSLEVADLYDPAGRGGLYFADLDGDLDWDIAPIQFNLSSIEVAGFWVGELPALASVQAPALAIGVHHDGDWHAAVDYYTSFHPPIDPLVPPWFREQGALYTHSGGGAGSIYLGPPYAGLPPLKDRLCAMPHGCSFYSLPDLLEEAQALGTNVLYLWDYWEGAPGDEAHAYFFKGDYVPRADLGGPVAFREGIRRVHEAGGRVIVYVESFIISDNSDLAVNRGGRLWAGTDPTGQFARWYAPSPPFDQVPSATYDKMVAPYSNWQTELTNIATRLVRDDQVDGIFLDSGGWQLNWQASVPADSSQPPFSSLQFSQGVLEMARNLRRDVKNLNPWTPDPVVLGETTSGEMRRGWDGGLGGDFFFDWELRGNQEALLASPTRYGAPEANYYGNGRTLDELHEVYAAGHSLALCCNFDMGPGPARFIFENQDHVRTLVQRRQQFKDALIYGSQTYQPATGAPGVAAYRYSGASDQILTVVNTSGEVYDGALTLRPEDAATTWVETVSEPGFPHLRAPDTRFPMTVPAHGLRVLRRWNADGPTAGHIGVLGAPLTIARAGADASGVTLAWGPSCRAGDGDYAVYEGTLGNFISHVPLTCTTGGALSFSFVPGGGNRYYLVVPHNADNEGSYGTDSAGQEREASKVACLPQAIAPQCP
jgi:hypothetical protein